MNKSIIAAALVLASAGAWAATPMVICTSSQLERVSPDTRETLQKQCVFYNAGRDCEKQANKKGLAGSAKKDFMTTCVRQAGNRAQWQRR